MENKDKLLTVEYLMKWHELNEQKAKSLLEFCDKHTIRHESCYGDGSIMFPKWLETQSDKVDKTMINMGNREIEKLAIEYAETFRFKQPKQVEVNKCPTCNSEVSIIGDTTKFMAAKEVEAVEFAEWCGNKYVKLHSAWVSRYVSETDSKLYHTTKQLYEIFKNQK